MIAATLLSRFVFTDCPFSIDGAMGIAVSLLIMKAGFSVAKETADLLLGDIYKTPGSVVCDTHCIRICNLLGLASGKDPAKVEQQLRAILPPEESSDFCHRLVLHGRAVCAARKPACAST